MRLLGRDNDLTAVLSRLGLDDAEKQQSNSFWHGTDRGESLTLAAIECHHIEVSEVAVLPGLQIVLALDSEDGAGQP